MKLRALERIFVLRWHFNQFSFQRLNQFDQKKEEKFIFVWQRLDSLNLILVLADTLSVVDFLQYDFE